MDPPLSQDSPSQNLGDATPRIDTYAEAEADTGTDMYRAQRRKKRSNQKQIPSHKREKQRGHLDEMT